jgi:hypothetical protein
MTQEDGMGRKMKDRDVVPIRAERRHEAAFQRYPNQGWRIVDGIMKEFLLGGFKEIQEMDVNLGAETKTKNLWRRHRPNALSTLATQS